MLSQEVEAVVAGMILREPKNLATALSLGVRLGDFTEPACRAVMSAAHELWRSQQAIDLASVIRLAGREHAQAIKTMRSDAPITQNFEPYAQALVDQRNQGELMTALLEISRSLTRRQTLEPLAPILKRLGDLIAHCRGSERVAKTSALKDALAASLEDVENRIVTQRVGLPPGVPTGIVALDRVIYGFQKGSVYILGARTSMGKTTMAVNMALSGAEARKKVALFTVEMSAVDIANKMITRAARVSSSKYLVGNLSEAEIDRIHHGTNVVGPLPIVLVEVTTPTLDVLEFEIMRLVKVEKVDLVIVDYLQLFEVGDGRNRPPREEAKIVSTRLKMMARSLDVPILILSQLSRQAPEYGEPDLTHIAESDQIARDADVVMFLYRNTEEGPFCISVAKNRRGMKVAVALKAELEYSHFSQAPHER